MARQTQLITFLKDAPGELAKLCEVLKERQINILAMSIQNAEDYIRGLFKAREITGRRIAPAANYGSVIRDSVDYSVIRFIVEPEQTQLALDVLRQKGYLIEETLVLTVVLQNRPGALGSMAKAFSDAGININYVYGSALADTDRSLFVVHVSQDDMDKAQSLFQSQ